MQKKIKIYKNWWALTEYTYIYVVKAECIADDGNVYCGR